MLNEDWKSVYGSSLSPTLTGGKYSTQQSNLGNDNIYILSCEFNTCSSSSSGGAIFVNSSSSTKMLIEESVFKFCKNTRGSGAISFDTGGNCAISRMCGFNCIASQKYAFAEIYCKDDINTKNDLIDSSICSCNDSYEIKINQRGNVTHSKNNISFNACRCNAVCGCHPSFIVY